MKKVLTIIFFMLYAPMTSAQWADASKNNTADSKGNQYYDMANNIWGWHIDSAKKSSPQTAVADSTLSTPAEEMTTADTSVILPDLPNYKQIDSESFNQNSEEYINALDNTSVVESEASEGDPTLKRLKSGVAVKAINLKKWNLKRITKASLSSLQIDDVELLDIGREARINANDLVNNNLKVPVFLYSEAKPATNVDSSAILKEVRKMAAQPLRRIKPVRRLQGKRWELGKVVSLDQINTIETQIVAVEKYEEKPVEEITKFDIFLYAAILLYQKERYPVALGLFDQVSQDKKNSEEANFYLGLTANKLKLHSESVHRLTPIVKNNKMDYLKEAIETLTSDLPTEYELTVAKSLEKVRKADHLSEDLREKINYHLAKLSYSQEKYKSAKVYASSISAAGKNYAKAQYIHAISDYMLGNPKNAQSRLEDLKSHMASHKVKDKNLDNLIAVNLGRIYFQNGSSKQAYNSYKNIDKDHPLWVEALIEQGWAQVALGDHSGAIGNMYSIHSPYFKSVFMPESFAIRSIGYLNICQYGDSYKSLSKLEDQYRSWKTKLNTYMTTATPKKAYSTVSSYLQKNSQTNVDNLPYQVVREVSRKKNFLNVQNSVNEKIDEVRFYKNLQKKIIADRKNTKNNLKDSKKRLRAVVAKLKNMTASKKTKEIDNSNKALLKLEKERVISYAFQDNLIKQSYRNYKAMKKRTIPRVEGEMSKLRNLSAQVLHSNMKAAQKQMDVVLNNNEFLRYETFAGSGENIRFQVSGGKQNGTANRIPASIKPKKILNWKFAGEFWEDEIGAYRSTLVNNCPKNLAQHETEE